MQATDPQWGKWWGRNLARSLLTALAIKHAKKDKLSDGEGLYLHRAKSGTWYWTFIYTRHGRRREMSLGPYGAGTGQVREKADGKQKSPPCETTIRSADGTWPTGLDLAPLEWVRVIRSRRKKRTSDPMALKAQLAADLKRRGQ